MISCVFRTVFSVFLTFPFFYLQQQTGERKQMAKAIAAVSKTSKSSSSSSKRRPTSSSPAVPPIKRRSYQPDRVVTCYNCQQPGHIAPRCPSRPVAASTPAAKAPAKKWEAFSFLYLLLSINIFFSVLSFSRHFPTFIRFCCMIFLFIDIWQRLLPRRCSSMGWGVQTGTLRFPFDHYYYFVMIFFFIFYSNQKLYFLVQYFNIIFDFICCYLFLSSPVHRG